MILAVEVVSPESTSRDRETKPTKYARAGIAHYWRVENDEGRAVACVFELEPATRVYAPTGVFHDRLKTSVPFSVDLDLATITPRRQGSMTPTQSSSARIAPDIMKGPKGIWVRREARRVRRRATAQAAARREA